jgi:hypothetical protein
MEWAVLGDLLFVSVTLLMVALLIYGAWLCIGEAAHAAPPPSPRPRANSPAEAGEQEEASEPSVGAMAAVSLVMPAVLLVLVACQTAFAQGMDPEPGCIQGLAKRADLKAISGKIWLAGARHQPFEFMTQPDWVEVQDRKLLTAWMRGRQECFAKGQAWRERHASASDTALSKWVYGRFVELGGLLYAGELSYGEFSQARAELSMEAVFALGALGAGRD